MIQVDENLTYWKYYRFNENSISCLITNGIWMAHPSSFNDPFDARIELPPTFVKEVKNEIIKNIDQCLPGHGNKGRRELVLSGLDKQADPTDILKLLYLNGIFLDKKLIPLVHLVYLIDDIYKRIGICSFARPKDQAAQRLMWSHYGDSHRGFCLGYRFTVKEIKEAKLNSGDVTNNEMPVPFPMEKFMKEFDKASIMDWVMQRIQVKDVIWNYEQEFRLAGSYKNQLIPIPGEIVEITLGLRMQQPHRDILKKLLKTTPHLCKIKIREVIEKYDSFVHEENEIENT